MKENTSRAFLAYVFLQLIELIYLCLYLISIAKQTTRAKQMNKESLPWKSNLNN